MTTPDLYYCADCDLKFDFEFYLSDDLPECPECGGDVEPVPAVVPAVVPAPEPAKAGGL